MLDHDFRPVTCPTDRTSLPRSVRAPDGLRPGRPLYVDMSTPGQAIVYGRKVERLPHWIECKVEVNVAANILVKLPQ